MNPFQLLEQSQDMLSMQDAKNLARAAFLYGKVCAVIERDGVNGTGFDAQTIADAMQWQAFYEVERNPQVHPAFRGILDSIGGAG